jgi:hypothetical protein
LKIDNVKARFSSLVASRFFRDFFFTRVCLSTNHFNFCLLFTSGHEIAKREVAEPMEIVGFRIDHADNEPSIEDGVPVLRAGSRIRLRLFGRGFTNRTHIGLSPEKLEFGGACNMMTVSGFTLELESSVNAVVEIVLPKHSVELYFCATNDEVSRKESHK